jgi:hypothetical protein
MLELVLRDVESKKEYGTCLLHNQLKNEKTDGLFYNLFHNYQFVVEGKVKTYLIKGKCFITGTADKSKQEAQKIAFMAKIAKK